MSMKLLVVGGSGLVGSSVVELALAHGWDVRATYRTRESEHAAVVLDKTDAERTAAVVERFEPDVVVDAAAFHDVDACETERDLAWAVNAAGTRNVAVAADGVGAHLIYLSTDYVFDGDPSGAPHAEPDPISPINYYAETKYAGEIAADIAAASTVLRSSVIYGTGRSNFATWALGELEDGEELRIVNDQVSAPTYAPDLARACLDVAANGETGLYHAAGPASLSRYEFTTALAQAFGHDTDRVTPITTEELGQSAPRPADSALDSSRLYDAIDYRFRRPEAAFAEMRAER